MKEIKFRFWVDGRNGEFMIYPDNRENSNFNSEGWEFYLDDEGFEIINHRGVVEPAHHVPMQYTGSKDKKGLEVYFNDVVEDECGHRYEVVFEGDCLRCNGIRKIRGGHKPKNRRFGIDLEIIGNRFENPKLLEE